MGRRHERLTELFFKEISFTLKNINGLNSYGILTLTGVKLASDMKELDVYFSVYGSDNDKIKSHKILVKSTWGIRQILKKRLRLRVIPNINFKFDSTPDEASKIEELFGKLREEDRADDNRDDDRKRIGHGKRIQKNTKINS
ncbi:MAG: 30S ribosome-binding factor RbfA [Elusimicrobia bacterium]|nr:30S ribosome-binding factor RbfA [Elusimicrobiota bacterium]